LHRGTPGPFSVPKRGQVTLRPALFSSPFVADNPAVQPEPGSNKGMPLAGTRNGNGRGEG
jgi:hypothetical protein